MRALAADHAAPATLVPSRPPPELYRKPYRLHQQVAESGNGWRGVLGEAGTIVSKRDLDLLFRARVHSTLVQTPGKRA